ncbi:MAG TPA: ABC transporter ATP-binding protein [Solirubrobacterales bacterium]|nr:ABC transporter ATP-binding protein [Solirubrobacterales bacterium]
MRISTNVKPRAAAAKLWARLWREFSAAERHRLVVALAAMLVASGLTAILPLLIGSLVDGSLAGGTVTLSGSINLLALTAVIVIVGQLLQVVRRQLVENVATGFERDSRIRAYEQLLHLDLGHLREDRIGSLYGRTNRSIEGAVKLVKLGALDLLPAISLSAAALVVAFAKNPFVGLAMFGVVPTGFLLVGWQVRNQEGIRVEVRDHKDAIDGRVTELLPALDTIRASGAEGYFIDQVKSGCEELRTTELQHHRAMSLFDAAKSINEGLWLVAVLCVALALTAAGRISAGEITAYVLLFAAVLAPLRELHRILDEASEASLQTHDLFDLLDSSPDASYVLPAPRGASPPPASRAGHPAIAVRDLSYAHPGAEADVLADLDFELRGGERVGVVGESGCGKSTLLRLLGRLHHCYSGEIELFGEDLQAISRQRLAARIGYVSQEPRIFRASVRDNITLGRTDVSDGEVTAAARRAQIHETILAMPHGYETVVAERGDTISGGQKQRICLARVLLRDPELLLLDEPTSALDNSSERAVQATIDQLDGIATLIVAHRLSTIRNTDRVVVLAGGHIAEEGSFDGLARAGGSFARMLELERFETETASAPAIAAG